MHSTQATRQKRLITAQLPNNFILHPQNRETRLLRLGPVAVHCRSASRRKNPAIHSTNTQYSHSALMRKFFNRLSISRSGDEAGTVTKQLSASCGSRAQQMAIALHLITLTRHYPFIACK